MRFLAPFIFFYLIFLPWFAQGQQIVKLNDSIGQHIFSYQEIELLIDHQDQFTFQQIQSPQFESRFQPSSMSTPQALELNTSYWFKIRFSTAEQLERDYLLEFFDQTIDEIEVYSRLNDTTFHTLKLGDKLPFRERPLIHKNFEVLLDLEPNQIYTYYVKVKSSQISDVIIVLRSVDYFIAYALKEYFSFGIFYGMIFVFSFYNLIMYIAVRRKQYLYYVLYLISVALFEMCSDGVAYQFFWPESPEWNQVAFAFASVSASTFVLLFTRELFRLHERVRWLNQLIIYTLAIRLSFFIFSLLFQPSLLNYKFIEFIPLTVAFFAGLYMFFIKRHRPARFFVIGYGFIVIGFLIKLFIMLGIPQLNFGVIGYYSLSISFVLEMIFFSLAIGEGLRYFKEQREKLRNQIIKQMGENVALKDTLNRELKSEVRQRNRELEKANDLLQQQAVEISRMNDLLQKDNIDLQHDNEALITNVKKIARERALSTEVDFDEFSATYPDPESCYIFLAELKWSEGYHCRRCANAQYFQGNSPHSRRCTKCGYDESVTAYTIFHNSRIPINKSFYMTFLLYNSRGKISSHKLSEIVGIRQSTCWAFASRIKKILNERKNQLKAGQKHGWSQLVLVDASESPKKRIVF